MNWTAGIDVGSTYTKAVILDPSDSIAGRAMAKTGFRLGEAAQKVYAMALADAGLEEEEIAYVMATGYGRFQVAFRDLQVTDLTAAARGARFLFPGTRTVLDVGGQTMKASRIDPARKVRTFRLNDKCASGTGMFLEKTVRYMGYTTEDIGGLLESATEAVPISGVCTVFAESEVINHLSNSVPPADIMFGASLSLTQRSVQLLKRIKVEPEVTLVGGIMRWGAMSKAITEHLGMEVNVADDDMPQYMAALGCALLGHIRLRKLREAAPDAVKQSAA